MTLFPPPYGTDTYLKKNMKNNINLIIKYIGSRVSIGKYIGFRGLSTFQARKFEKNKIDIKRESGNVVLDESSDTQVSMDDAVYTPRTIRESKDHYSKYSPEYTANFMNHLFDVLYVNYDSNNIVVNEDVQRRMEEIILDEYDVFFSHNNKVRIQGGVNTDLIVPKLIRFIMERSEVLKVSIENLYKMFETMNTSRNDKVLMRDIFKVVDQDFLLNICLVQYLLVYTNQDTEHDKHYNSLTVSVTMGKKIVTSYFYKLKNKYIEENNENITYTS